MNKSNILAARFGGPRPRMVPTLVLDCHHIKDRLSSATSDPSTKSLPKKQQVMAPQKVWFSLKKGDIVFATARNPSALSDPTSSYPPTQLATFPPDVTSSSAIVLAAFARGVGHGCGLLCCFWLFLCRDFSAL
ncbi:hypothetical protein BV22DRAFT_251413 [Leucogyrophana mollusca]|uniref:Uncharacterized protein n=1 Tax=Leucogyrophana mollusca TaxID=85980 RepID=A0ACB8BSA7_9AGAM|nr:hypothetical protein BV22DRAFT_251413 [Leucogyrophana mollusca]